MRFPIAFVAMLAACTAANDQRETAPADGDGGPGSADADGAVDGDGGRSPFDPFPDAEVSVARDGGADAGDRGDPDARVDDAGREADAGDAIRDAGDVTEDAGDTSDGTLDAIGSVIDASDSTVDASNRVVDASDSAVGHRDDAGDADDAAVDASDDAAVDADRDADRGDAAPGDPCPEGAVETRPCPEGGRRARACVDGVYGEWSDCPPPDGPCEPGAAEIEACPGVPDARRARRCATGEWSAWSDCHVRCDAAEAACRACTDAAEVNDVQALAAEVAPASFVPNLTMCDGLDDVDWYTVAAPGAGLLSMTATRALDGAFNFQMEGVGVGPADVWTSLASSVSTTTLYAYVSGPTWVDARLWPHLPGPNARSGYSLQTNFAPSIACEYNGDQAGCLRCLDGAPADDRPADARRIQLGERVEGVVCAGIDPQDYQTFTLGRRTSIRIDATLAGNLRTQGDVTDFVFVLDARGQFVINGGQHEGGVVVSRGTLDAGSYFIQRYTRAGVGQYRYTVRESP